MLNLLYANDKPGEHAPSWYRDTSDADSHPQLESNIEADVCIVGAGFTGLAAALELAKQGLQCTILEAHRVGWGASGRNGGQLGTGFNMDQIALESMMGHKHARDLWTIAESAKRWILDTCRDHHIDIEYQPGIVYAQHRQRYVKPLHQYCEHLQLNYNYMDMQPLSARTIGDHVNSQNYVGGAIDKGAGHIHPLKLAKGLARTALAAGVEIYERSQVIRIQRSPRNALQRVVTPTGSVSCRHVILATNGYFVSLEQRMHRRLMPINNFIVVTEPLGERAAQLLPLNDAVADSRFVVNYFRRVAGDRLLFGGGENYSYRFPTHIAPMVRKAMLEIFPELQNVAIDYAWGGTLAITRNRLPYIGELESDRFTAGGYSGHGVALACIYGKALAGKIAGDAEIYRTLTKLPNTPFPGGFRSRSILLAVAMTGYSWMDKL